MRSDFNSELILQTFISSQLSRPVVLCCCQADWRCDVMLSDSLLTLCCPSASSVDTNTSNLFQLRAALLSQTIVTIAAQRACRVTSECA